MKAFIKKHLSLILLSTIAVVFFALAIVGMGNLNTPSTYYRTGEIATTGGYNALVYEVDLSSGEGYSLDSVWVNFGSNDSTKDVTSKIKVFACNASNTDSTFYRTATKEFVNNFRPSNQNEKSLNVGVWQNLISSADIGSMGSRKVFMFAVNYDVNLKVNELAFIGVNDEGDLVKLNAKALASGAKDDLTTSLNSSGELYNDQVGRAYANKLIDEFSKFELGRINGSTYSSDPRSLLTLEEVYRADAIKNLLDGTSFNIDQSSNPVGNYILSLGTLVFGYNPVGMRIIPTLFALGSIVMLYFLGKLLTKSETCGLLLAFLFAVGGYSLSFATVGSVATIFTFFMVLSTYFAVKYYKSGVNFKNPQKDYFNILLSGVAFSLALTIKSQAIYFAFAIVLLFAFSTLVKYKGYLFNVKQKHPEREVKQIRSRYLKLSVPNFVLAFISYLLVPFVFVVASFLIAYPTISGFYNVNNLFLGLSKHFMSVLTSSALGFGSVIGLTFIDFDGKMAFGNIAVIAINVIGILLAIVYAVSLFVKKEGLNAKNRNNYILPLIFSLVAFLSIWIIDAIVGSSLEVYMCASIFASIIVVLLYNALSKQFNKPLFTLKGYGVNAVNLTAVILVIISVVALGLGIPSLIGIGEYIPFYIIGYKG